MSKRYDWDALLDGSEHVLKRGVDFDGTVGAASAMVRFRARQRGVDVTASIVDAETIKIEQGDPAARKGAPRGSRSKPKARRTKGGGKAAPASSSTLDVPPPPPAPPPPSKTS